MNRHLDRDFASQIPVSGFAPAQSARVQEISGTSLYRAHDEMRPEAVHPREDRIGVLGPSLAYTFPHASVTD